MSTTEASFKVAHILRKHKKPFTSGGIVKEFSAVVAETFFKELKSKIEVMSAIANMQLGVNTVARRVSAQMLCFIHQRLIRSQNLFRLSAPFEAKQHRSWRSHSPH